MDDAKSTNTTAGHKDKASITKKPVAFGRSSSTHQKLEDKENMPVNQQSSGNKNDKKYISTIDHEHNEQQEKPHIEKHRDFGKVPSQ